MYDVIGSADMLRFCSRAFLKFIGDVADNGVVIIEFIDDWGRRYKSTSFCHGVCYY